MSTGFMSDIKGKILGQVNDAWMSRELMLAYFADKDVISNKVNCCRFPNRSPLISSSKKTWQKDSKSLSNPRQSQVQEQCISLLRKVGYTVQSLSGMIENYTALVAPPTPR